MEDASFRSGHEGPCYYMEVSVNQGHDFYSSLSECKQNPGHKRFVPVEQFTKKNLPEQYRDSQLFDLIQVLAELTVRVLVTHTNKDRPPNHPFLQATYPGRHLVGKDCVRAGSGWVHNVSIYRDDDSLELCPCSDCENSGKPEKVWGRIAVATANHVVFNTEEAMATKIDLFYNENVENPGTANCTQISGYKVWYSNMSEDKCWIYCATHDMELCTKLASFVSSLEKLKLQVYEKYKNVKKAHLAVTVLHPHGCAKQVSMSQWASTELNIDSTWWAKATYQPMACPGSSGAPVWSLGKKELEAWRLP